MVLEMVAEMDEMIVTVKDFSRSMTRPSPGRTMLKPASWQIFDIRPAQDLPELLQGHGKRWGNSSRSRLVHLSASSPPPVIHQAASSTRTATVARAAARNIIHLISLAPSLRLGKHVSQAAQ